MLGHELQYGASRWSQKMVPERSLSDAGSLLNTTVTLKIISGNDPHPLRTLILPATIGRTSDQGSRPASHNGLFHNPFLSRHHAVLRMDQNKLVVEDLGSSNGTFVNGVAVKSGEIWPVANGDLLQFGSEDEKDNAAIVAQIFYETSKTMISNNTVAKNINSASDRRDSNIIRGGIRPEADLMTLSDSNIPLGRGKEKSFPEIPDLLSSTEHLSGLGCSSLMIRNANDCAESIAMKIADITRALASYGIKVRTRTLTGMSKQSFPGTLKVLESIEELLVKLDQDESIRGDPFQLRNDSALVVSPTIHQRPDLTVAMSIIVSRQLFVLMTLLTCLFLIIVMLRVGFLSINGGLGNLGYLEWLKHNKTCKSIRESPIKVAGF